MFSEWSNTHFYTVSVRTFVISFYSGSATEKSYGHYYYGFGSESGSATLLIK
jgi:hypothetical protein